MRHTNSEYLYYFIEQSFFVKLVNIINVWHVFLFFSFQYFIACRFRVVRFISSYDECLFIKATEILPMWYAK